MSPRNVRAAPSGMVAVVDRGSAGTQPQRGQRCLDGKLTNCGSFVSGSPMNRLGCGVQAWSRPWGELHCSQFLFKPFFCDQVIPMLLTSCRVLVRACVLLALTSLSAAAGTKTWDGRHDTSMIDVKVVYFVPQDRNALQDWRDRLDYYAERLERFHRREFQGQSKLNIQVHPEPFVSNATTQELRRGDANRIFFQTLSEVDQRLKFARGDQQAGFPILLVLSEINHRPLDDFYRLIHIDGTFRFEGVDRNGLHFPGSSRGGARATYMADRGIGWGLVSAYGWRVPYLGSECVVYHEGLGHTVGLPHPEPGNGSVMSQGQYRGGLNLSWLDKDQKQRMGWKLSKGDAVSADPAFEIRALPFPQRPRPGQMVGLKLDVPEKVQVQGVRVRYQTAIDGPWIDALTVNEPQLAKVADKSSRTINVKVAAFERPTPVSYRVDIQTDKGETEIWGYLQVRDASNTAPRPGQLKSDLYEDQVTTVWQADSPPPATRIDLLEGLDIKKQFQRGEWEMKDGILQSNKAFGVRLEIPAKLPESYQITAFVKPLDAANGFLLGLNRSGHRFASLVNYRASDRTLSALENIDGQNVGNETTYRGNLLRKDQLSQVVVKVSPEGVRVSVDGRQIIRWEGKPEQMSLGDYWSTPDASAVFIGAYDCRYQIHRLTLEAN